MRCVCNSLAATWIKYPIPNTATLPFPSPSLHVNDPTGPFFLLHADNARSVIHTPTNG